MCARSVVAAIYDRRSALGERRYNCPYKCRYNCPCNLGRWADQPKFIFGELGQAPPIPLTLSKQWRY
jgi:hypothetical protein